MAIVAVSAGIGWADPGSAAPGAATHRGNFGLVDPSGKPVTKEDPYRYVVPAAANKGAFYTFAEKRYYTPAVEKADDEPVAVKPRELAFGGFEHQHELAERLERLTNEFCLDLYYNYRHNPDFRVTYREAYQLLRDAKSLHRNADHGRMDLSRRSVRRIDQLFHHVQDDVREWVGDDHQTIGQLSLPAKVEELEALIHHLMYDLGVEPDHHHDHDDSSSDEEAPAP
jgi:hypothetical protein